MTIRTLILFNVVSFVTLTLLSAFANARSLEGQTFESIHRTCVSNMHDNGGAYVRDNVSKIFLQFDSGSVRVTARTLNEDKSTLAEYDSDKEIIGWLNNTGVIEKYRLYWNGDIMILYSSSFGVKGSCPPDQLLKAEFYNFN